MHVSNLFLNLDPVIHNVAKQFGYHAAHYECATADDAKGWEANAWIVLTPDRAMLDTPVAAP